MSPHALQGRTLSQSWLLRCPLPLHLRGFQTLKAVEIKAGIKACPKGSQSKLEMQLQQQSQDAS